MKSIRDHRSTSLPGNSGPVPDARKDREPAGTSPGIRRPGLAARWKSTIRVALLAQS